MIVVRVELWSAVTGKVQELARMRICNDGRSALASRGDYDGETFRGRDSAALDRGVVSKKARVEAYPRQSQHVWNLIARMLKAMDYS